MKADPVDLVITYLKAQPEMAGYPVAADLVGHDIGAFRVEVRFGGGGRIVRDIEDRWNITINYYGPTKRETAALALLTRELLIERLRAQRFNGVTVNDVHEGHAPTDHSDSVVGEQRFLHLISIDLR